jgi:anti-sigma-K factor RskA
MIDETLQDDAGLYVMRMLPPEEAAAFEKRMAMDAELRAFVNDLEHASGYLAHAAPTVAPPPDLKQRILSDIRHEVRVVPMSMSSRSTWVPWAIAAGLAIAAVMGWQQAGFYRDQSHAQGIALADLRNRDALASVRIATLNSQVTAYQKALAVVIFDAEQQRGVVNVNIPKPAANKDYQLWVIPAAGKPVSGGLVPVGDDGLARVSFKPTQPVKDIGAFAISVEPAGGSEQPAGEVIMVGK